MKTFKLDKDGTFNDFHSAVAGFLMFWGLMSIILAGLANTVEVANKVYIQSVILILLASLAFYLHKYKNQSFMIYIMEILIFMYLIYSLIF